MPTPKPPPTSPGRAHSTRARVSYRVNKEVTHGSARFFAQATALGRTATPGQLHLLWVQAGLPEGSVVPDQVYATMMEVGSMADARGWAPSTYKRNLSRALNHRSRKPAGKPKTVGQELDNLAARWHTSINAVVSYEVPVQALQEYMGAIKEADIPTKEWVAIMDDRTRPTHEAVNGTIIPSGDLFMVGGAAMTGPGDPSGGPEEVANCRCVLIGVEEKD